MKIKIYSQDGTLKLTASPGSGGQCVKQLQGDSELTLSFDYFEYVALDVNDYMDFCGDRYWLLEQYRPKEVSTVQWKYDVHLYGIESLIKRYLVIEHTDGDANPVFTLTAPASQHMRMIVECLNNATGTTDWHVGTVETTGNITIDYTGKYCDEGLRELAEAANTEYWFDGRTVNLCKCERGTALQLGYDDGLISLERDVADNAKFYTRLYPVGSSRNINPETYGHTRLQLPDGQKYVDLDVAKYGVIDHYEQEAFSGIYPRYTGTVSGVRVEDRTDEDGTEFKVFFFSDASLPFDPNSYLLPNEKMRVSFQTGDLQGLGDTDDHYFEADYNSTTGEFEIINIWTEGEQLPRPGLSPAVGDQYIPWNISMPASYITLAEQEFAAAVNTYNQEHFKDISVYRGTTDHVWIEADPAQDKPEVDVFIGRRVRLVSSQYFPGTGYRDSRIVKITRRLDLPSQMELEISDAVSTGTLTKISDDIRGVWEFAKGLEVDGDDRWLSKRRNDTAQGFIRFIRGLQVGERFVTGLLGEGGVFRKEADGTTYLETDKLYVRMKAYFDSVDVRDYIHSAGNRVASQAKGFTCSRVEWLDANGNILEQTQENLSSVAIFRCYWRVDDGDKKTDNQFRIGDLAFCQDTEVTNDSLTTHGFHRLVVGRNPGTETTAEGEAWIDLSNAHESNGNPKRVTITWSGQGGTQQSMSALSFRNGSDAPVKEDDIVQLGSVNDPGRQGAIIEFVSGADAPSYQIFQGIGADASNPYSLTDKNYLSLGYATGPSDTHGSGHAYIEVFGDVFIGAQPNPQTGESPTYIRYDQDTQQLDIKANVTFTSPIDGKTDIEDFARAVTTDIENIQNQIDGTIETWFYNGVPSENVLPESEWKAIDQAAGDNNERLKHLGDLYYDNQTGYAYRYSNTGTEVSPTFVWNPISDSAVVKALDDAARAKDTADHKRRVFATTQAHPTPYPPYDVGDLWVNANYTNPVTQEVMYNNDILRCITSQGENGSFSIDHWVLASKYTDDSALTDFVTNTYAQDLANLETQIDGKAETWYQDSDPSTAWTDTDTKVAHVGDIWYDTSANGGKKTYIWRDRGEGHSNRFYWAEQAVPDDVFDEIDGKAAIYVEWGAWINQTTGENELKVKDLFIPSADVTPTGSSVTYYANKVYRCTNASTPTFQEIHYTDDATVNQIIAKYGQIMNIGNPTATNVGEAIGLLNGILKNSNTQIDGGLILTSAIYMKDTGSSPSIWAGISGVRQSTETGSAGKGWKGHGVAAWYGGGVSSSIPIDKECLTATEIADGWNGNTYHLRWARGLDRFDGSGYRADGNISWDAVGNVTIQGYQIKVGNYDVATMNDLSGYVTLTTDQTITGAKTFTGGLVANRIYLYKPNLGNDNGAVYLEYSSAKQGVCLVGGGLFTNSYLSAHGAGSGGGSGSESLNQPLSGINSSAGLAAPTTAGQALVYNGSEWKYSNAPGTKLSVGGNLSVGGTVTGTMFSGAGFKISGLPNGDNYVLLAGGGKVALSDIGGGSYLPLTGGELSLSTLSGFVVDRASNANSFVTFKGKVSDNAGTLLGYLGFSDINTPAFRTTGGTNRTLWHSGNFTPSDYVLTNSTRSIVVGGGNYNFYSPSNTALNLDSVYGRLAEYDSGGGTSSSSVDINTITTPGVYAGNGSYYYIGDPSVALPSTTYFRLEVSVTRGTGSGTYLRQRLQYYNGYNVRERRSTDGGATWTDFAVVQRDLTNYPSISDSETANYVFATPNGSAGVPSFRHIVPADIYTHSSTGDITNDNTEFFSSYQSDDGFNNTTHGNKIYRRPVSALWAYTKSKMTADTTLNVASATKLQTARTLWGQSFDGTADVSGSITGATSITATGLTTTKTLSISSTSAVAHLIFSRGGNNYITAPSGGNISFVCGGKSVSNANRDMYISDGAVNITGTLNVSSNSTIGGTLGVTGVTTLGGALDVTGAATLSSTLAVTGDTTLGSTLYVNGTTVSQTIRAKTDKTYNLGSSSYYWKYLYVTRIYLASGVYLEYNSNKAGVHLVGAGLYSDSFLSAHGAGSGGGSGSVSLNQPLSGINSAGLAAPNSNLPYQAIVWTGSKWDYSINTTILANKFLANTDIIVQNGNLKVNYGRAAVGGAINSDYKLTVYGAGLFGNLAIGHTTSLSSVQLSCVTVEAKNSPLYLKTAIGYVYASAAYSNQSDIRLKDIVGDVNATVEDIAATRVFNFRWKRGDDTVMLGTSAQDWQRVLPYAVSVGPEGYLTLDYAGAALAATVITARKVVDHERRIAKLEAENKRLRKEIRELKSA